MIRSVFATICLFWFYKSTGQNYNDTLYFKSGLERACEVQYFDDHNLKYIYVTKKGDVVSPTVKIDQLKYFVIYDSLGVFQMSSKDQKVLAEFIEADTTKSFAAPDSAYFYKNLFSVNPLSLAFLGVNMRYVRRFGANLQYGIHVPVRLGSPILWPGVAFYTGVGFTAFIVNTQKFSMTLEGTFSVYLFGGPDPFFSVPVGLGFVRYLTPRLVVDGSLSVGFPIGNKQEIGYPIPAAHIGLGFQFGAKKSIKLDKPR